jgi:hypothetical protein
MIPMMRSIVNIIKTTNEANLALKVHKRRNPTIKTITVLQKI